MTNKNMDLAIETLREFVENTDNAIVKDAILELHPELAESKDEKIRMKMLEHFKSKTKKTWCNIPVEDIISFLEKQKVQNPKHPSSELEFADKYSKDVWEKLMTNFKTIQGYHIGCNDVSDIVLNAILDAFKWQEQDSLALVKNVVSYLEDCKYAPVVKGNISKEFYRIDIPPHEDDFWKSKEYKKCVEILGDYYCQGIYSSNTYKLYVKRTKKEQKSYEPHNWPADKDNLTQEQKQEWSEGDSVILNEIIDFFENGTVRLQHDLSMYAQWLKSLRPQQKQEWSEKDSKRLLSIGAVLETSTLLSKEEYDADMAWIRELVNVKKYFDHKAKQEWGKEDKEHIESILHRMDVQGAGSPYGRLKEDIIWLQSLLSRPKPSGNWKPTKDDKRILKGIIGFIDHDQHYGVSNEEMVEWLKKTFSEFLIKSLNYEKDNV